VVTPATPINGGPVPVLDPATGVVSVPPGTPAGSYTIGYEICEVLNPTNCATATITVTVGASTITATDDPLGPVNGAVGNPNAGNAYDNDTLGGAPVDPADITGRVVTPATPVNGGPVPVLDPATGIVSVPPGTPAGTYTIGYEICEVLNPTNCATATITVTVGAPVITAVDDSYTGVNGASGDPAVGNVLDRDTLNGVAITDLSLVDISIVGALPPQLTCRSRHRRDRRAAGYPGGRLHVRVPDLRGAQPDQLQHRDGDDHGRRTRDHRGRRHLHGRQRCLG